MKTKIYFTLISFVFLMVGWFSSYMYYSPMEAVKKEVVYESAVSKEDTDSYLTALEGLLTSYEKKLDSLTDVNSLLKSKLAFFDNQKAILSALPTFRKKILNLSEEDTKEKVESLFKHKHQLKGVDSYKQFSLRFIDLALEEDVIPEDISDADYLIDVRISISQDALYMDASDDNFEMSKYYKLYANISSSPPLKSVMLKWVNLSTGEVIRYIPFGTERENDIEYVWAKPKAGWEVGTYQVSLHKLNDSMALVARKLYRITSVVDEGEQPVYNGPTGTWSR